MSITIIIQGCNKQMLSNNLRTYSRIVRASNTNFLHNKYHCNFSSTSRPNLQALADYEYVIKIQQLLKENNINQALKYLINSHLHGKVLDRHIFRQYYQKVQQNQLPISYQEVAYKLYRTHFKPHILILDWMNSLARSNSSSLISLLKEDFNMLKLEMPNVQKADQDKQDTKAISNIKNTIKAETKPQASTTSTNSKQTQTKQVQQQQLKTASTSSQIQNISQVSKQHLSQIGHRLLNSLSSVSTTVTLHDIEIKYHNVEEQQKIGQLDLDKFINGQSLTTQHDHHHHHSNQIDNSNSNSRHITYSHNNNININNINNNNNYLDDDQVIQQEDNDGQEQYQEIWDRVQRIKIGRIQIKMRGNKQQTNANQQHQQTQVYHKIETLTTQKKNNKQTSQIYDKINEKENVKNNEKDNEKKP